MGTIRLIFILNLMLSLFIGVGILKAKTDHEIGSSKGSNSPTNLGLSLKQPPACVPGWTGRLIIACETTSGWGIEHDNGSTGKVTKCIWAEVFLKFDAGDIGWAYICHGDYAWTEGFNSKFKLVRDKTLMQGHDYCNHRYIGTG